MSGISPKERSTRTALWSQTRDWLRSLDKQNFVNEDVRVIVPVLSNNRGNRVRYWSVIGARLMKIKASYAVPPRVIDADHHHTSIDAARDYMKTMRKGETWPRAEWRAKDYVIPVQVFAEVTLGPKPLTREQFRSICDGCSSKSEVIGALQKASLRQSVVSTLPASLLAVMVIGCGLWVYRARRRREIEAH